jgi:hypothetical protein
VVLPHNGNKRRVVTMAHVVDTKETYTTIYGWLKKYATKRHRCADLKVVAMLTELQEDCTKFCCFLCARDGHYQVQQWRLQGEKILGQKKVAHRGLVDKTKIYFTSTSREPWVNQRICVGDE